MKQLYKRGQGCADVWIKVNKIYIVFFIQKALLIEEGYSINCYHLK